MNYKDYTNANKHIAMHKAGGALKLQQGGQAQQQQQIMQAIAQQLQQGAKPEQVVQSLVNEMQIPQEQAVQLVQQTMQMMQG